IVTISVAADGNLKLEVVVALVRLRAAQIPRDASRTQHHSREAPGLGVRAINDADIDRALFENAIVDYQSVDIVEHLQEWVQKLVDVLKQSFRQILVHAARPEIGGMHAAARDPLVKRKACLTGIPPPY